MASPIFLWTLANSAEMVTVLLWSKVVIITHGAQVTNFILQPTPGEARTAALEATVAAESRGLWLIAVHAHRGWTDLPTTISTAHQLYAVGHQNQALAVVVDGICKYIVAEGVNLDALGA